MNITLNNPLVLANITLLGVGMELRMDKVEYSWTVCLTIEALIWRKCWSW